MAPNGGTGTPVRFQSPLNDQSKLTLVSTADVTFTPEILQQNDQQVLVKGKSAALDATSDSTPKLKLGGTLESLSNPVQIKSMKTRFVRVAVHKVFGLNAAGQQTVPDLLPTEAALATYLSKVYGKQTNTFFSCTYYDEKGPAGTGIDFDLDNSLTLGYGENDPEQTAATPNHKVTEDPTSAHIDIWVIGGGVKLKSTGSIFGPLPPKLWVETGSNRRVAA